MSWHPDPAQYAEDRLAEMAAAQVAIPADRRDELAARFVKIAELTNPRGRVGGIARLSRDGRDGVPNFRQTSDVLNLAIREQLAVVRLYIDTDRSASRFATRKRERYLEAVDELMDGDLDGLVAYNLDRLWRRPREAEPVLERVLTHRVRLWACSGLSVSDADTVTQARMMVAFAANEAEATSRRVRRSLETVVERGTPNGGKIAFGRDRELDEHGRKRGAWTLHEQEAAVVREMADRVLAGEATNAICNDLNRRGIPTKEGKQWRPQTIRLLLTSAQVCGLRKWQPSEVVDGRRQPDRRVEPRYVPSPELEPIISEDDWREIVARFSDPARKVNMPNGNKRRFLGPGFAFCGRCDAKMKSARAGGSNTTPIYRCTGCGKVSRAHDRVDDVLREAAIVVYADGQAGNRGVVADPAAQEKATGTIDWVRRQRADLAAMLAAGTLDAAGYAAAIGPLADTEAEAQATLAVSSGRAAIPARTLREAERLWEQATLAERRQMLATAGIEVVIYPKGKGGSHERYAGIELRDRAD